jgi:uncharacterized membrane protein YjjB (DUF3815 family)
MIAELIASLMGTVAFSVLFGVPKKYYLDCGLIGLAGWLVYRLTQMAGVGNTFAVFFAVVIIILCSRITAVRRMCPATVFMITGIFPLVPGAQIYWAAYYLVTNQFDQAMSSGFTAIKVIIAIVLGIIFVFEIPGRFFLLFKPKAAK